MQKFVWVLDKNEKNLKKFRLGWESNLTFVMTGHNALSNTIIKPNTEQAIVSL